MVSVIAFSQEKFIFNDSYCGFSIDIPKGFEKNATNSLILLDYRKGNAVLQIKKIDFLSYYQSLDKSITRNRLNYTTWEPNTLEITLQGQSTTYFAGIKSQYPSLIIENREIQTINGNKCLLLSYSLPYEEDGISKKFYSMTYFFLKQGYQISITLYFSSDKAEEIRKLKESVLSFRFI